MGRSPGTRWTKPSCGPHSPSCIPLRGLLASLEGGNGARSQLHAFLRRADSTPAALPPTATPPHRDLISLLPDLEPQLRQLPPGNHLFSVSSLQGGAWRPMGAALSLSPGEPISSRPPGSAISSPSCPTWQKPVWFSTLQGSW